jgi:hypothetical protein
MVKQGKEKEGEEDGEEGKEEEEEGKEEGEEEEEDMSMASIYIVIMFAIFVAILAFILTSYGSQVNKQKFSAKLFKVLRRCTEIMVNSVPCLQKKKILGVLAVSMKNCNTRKTLELTSGRILSPARIIFSTENMIFIYV